MNVAAMCALAVCTAVMALYLRELRPEMARLLALAAGLAVMGAALPMAAEFVAGVKEFSAVSQPMNKFIQPLLKITGIAYIAQFSAEICRDAGENALAGRVEFAGKTAIALMSFPIIKDVFMSLMRIVGS
ncbi:MAG: SpoIIIAC/SpoIIIAD family protein [Clostridia bacterium]